MGEHLYGMIKEAGGFQTREVKPDDEAENLENAGR